jgi:ABC-type nitrate/sulfonate/bicarbonate transport system substrate-binding protein
MKGYQKYIRPVLVLAVMLLIIGTLTVPENKALFAAPASKPLVIAVSQTPLSAPFFIANDRGFFKKRGLVVDLQPCIGGTACAKALFTKNVDLATASESVIMFSAFKQTNFNILASFVGSDNDLKLLALPNPRIKSIHDLIGKKVGVIQASASEFYLDALLIMNNIPSTAINKVYLPPQQLKLQLLNRQVDAISAWEPIGYETEMQSETKLVNLGIPGIYQLTFNLLTNAPISAEAAEQNIRLLQALDESIAWMNANPILARTITAKRLNLPVEQLAWSWHDYTFRLSLGNGLLSNLQLQARWAIETGLEQPQMPLFRELFATDLFRQAVSSKEH